MAAALLRRSLVAYRDGDVAIALEVKEQDAELDKAYKATAKQLTRRMEEDVGAHQGLPRPPVHHPLPRAGRRPRQEHQRGRRLRRVGRGHPPRRSLSGAEMKPGRGRDTVLSASGSAIANPVINRATPVSGREGRRGCRW